MDAIRIMIVEDHPLFREGLRRSLELEEGFVVVGEAADGKEALEMALGLKPDIMLVDINIPGMNGLLLTRKVKEELPDTGVIVLTAYDEVARLTQREREQRAAERIFALLPPDQAQEFHQLWEEFADRHTPEARFAHALDRLAGVLANYCTGGGGWREHCVPKEKVLERNCVIGESAPELWALARQMIEETFSEMERDSE